MANVVLTILGVDKSAPAVQGINAIKGAFTALGVSAAAWKAYDLAKDATLMAARYATLGVTMAVVGNNAGYSAAQMTAFEQSLQRTGIASIESRQNLTQMAQAHIDLSKASELAREAQDAAVIGATNSSQAFSQMVYGIQTAQTEVLRTIGINVNFEDSYRKMASQIGKTSEELTEHEKIQARTNAVLEKGKDIAGSYEAAMGTAGKQISSMTRYVDNLKVTLGGVFQDALIVGVSAFTDGLKEANTESERLQREGKLKQWGRDLVTIMAVVGDAIHIVYLSMYTLVSAGVAGLTQLYYGAKAFGQAMTLNFSGAKDSFNEMLTSGSAWWEMTKDKWGGATMFQDAAKGMYAARDANAAKEKALGAEQEKTRMTAAAAAKKEQDAKDAAVQSEKKFLDNLKSSLSSITDYAAALADLGKERLKFADERFSDQLKKEVELYEKGKAAMSDLATPLKRYNVEVNDVYNQRLAIEQSALAKIGNLYTDFKNRVKLAANSKDVQQHGVDIVKAYKDAAQKIIAIEQDRYTTLYEAERKNYEQFKSLNDAKMAEIEALRLSIEEANKTLEASRRTATGNFGGGYEYLDPNLDELAKRQAMVDKLRRDEASAAAIQDPSRRNEQLLKVADAWGQLTDKVDLAGQTVITTEQAWQTAMSERDRIQQQVFGNLESQQKEAAAREQEAANRLDQYRQKLLDLDGILKNMTSTITIDLQVNGMEQISRIQALLGQSLTAGGASGGSSVTVSGLDAPFMGQMATGTNRVPADGYAFLHQGEAVVPKAYNPAAGGAGGDTYITIPGGINVTIQGGGTNQQSAAAIARQIYPEIQKLANRKAA